LELFLELVSEMDSEAVSRMGDTRKGRTLRLDFSGSPPELTQIAYKDSEEFELKETPRMKSRSGFQWGKAAKGFSKCLLKYLMSDPREDVRLKEKEEEILVFIYSGEANTYTASLGLAVNDGDGWLTRALVKKRKGLEDASVVQSIFRGGANKAGKKANLRRNIWVDTKFLPRECIEIRWQPTPEHPLEIVVGSEVPDLFAGIPEKNEETTKSPTKVRTRSRQLPSVVSTSHFRMHQGDVFGRDEWLQKLNAAWNDANVNVFTLWAWGGMGKSVIIEKWLQDLKKADYHNSDVLAWSFDSSDSGNVDAFLNFALTMFKDPFPTHGQRWEKGHRLASLIQKRSVLLILDGLERVQNPPAPEAGKLSDSAIEFLLRELVDRNPDGLCVITTRYPVADLEPYTGSSMVCSELNPLSPVDGRVLLRACKIKGDSLELEKVSDFFGGHALTLTLLGSYLYTAWRGQIRKWRSVKLLKADEREGHAKSMMAAYESWFKNKPELSILHLVGLFDRPPDKEDLYAIRFKANIPGLTERLRALSSSEWNGMIRSLRDKRLITEKESSNPSAIEAHPLVREYFQESLRRHSPEIWQKGNEFLCAHYSARAPERPGTPVEMEHLFYAVMHGCKAGKHQKVLDEVYFPRIMRGAQRFAAEALGALSGLLSMLGYFFKDNNFVEPVETLNKGSRLSVIKEAAHYLTFVNGYGAPEVERCYVKGLEICDSRVITSQIELNLGLGRVFRIRGQLKQSGEIAQNLLDLSRGNPSLRSAAERAVATNFYYTGQFHKALVHAKNGIIKYPSRKEALRMANLDVNEPSLCCLGYQGLCKWFIGKPDQALADVDLAVKKAKILGHHHTIAVILLMKAMVHQFRMEVADTQKAATELTGFCTDKSFNLWQISGRILSTWANVRLGQKPSESVKDLIEDWKDNEAELFLPYWYGLGADAALAAKDWKGMEDLLVSGLSYSHKNTEHWWDAEIARLNGLLLTAEGDTQNGLKGLRAAIAQAMKQKALALELRSRAALTQFSQGIAEYTLNKKDLATCYNKFKEGRTAEMVEIAYIGIDLKAFNQDRTKH
jgi:hypothetical protein